MWWGRELDLDSPLGKSQQCSELCPPDKTGRVFTQLCSRPGSLAEHSYLHFRNRHKAHHKPSATCSFGGFYSLPNTRAGCRLNEADRELSTHPMATGQGCISSPQHGWFPALLELVRTLGAKRGFLVSWTPHKPYMSLILGSSFPHPCPGCSQLFDGAECFPAHSPEILP